MKKYVLLSMLLLNCFVTFSQKKTIKYEKIFSNNKKDKPVAEGNMVTIRDKYGSFIESYRTGVWKNYEENDVFFNNPSYDYYESYTKGEYEKGLRTGTWKTYVNGKLVLEAEFSDDKKNGKYVAYTENGKVSFKGEYKNDVEVNKQVVYRDNGEIYSEVNYDENGKKDGIWNMANWVGLRSIGNYDKNERIGIWRLVNDKTSTLLQTIDYSKGVSTAYFSNGKIESQLFFFYAPDKSIGFYNFLWFNENGSKRLEGNFNSAITYKVEKENDKELIEPKGIWTNFWEDGSPAIELDFENHTEKVLNLKMEEKYEYKNEKGNYGKGQKVIREIDFEYENGRPKISMIHVDLLNKTSSNWLDYVGPILYSRSFKRFGVWEYYSKGGVLLSKSNYNFITNGLDGTTTTYYASGKIKSKGEYGKNGKQTGMWQYYFENGKISEERTYENGKIQGIVVGYFESGAKKSKAAYVDDKLVGVKELYHPNGKLLGKEKYKDGKFDSDGDFYDEDGNITSQSGNGYRLDYFDNGKISFKGNLRNGNRHGLCSWYFENGNLKSELNYENGNLNGLNKWYFDNGSIKEKASYFNGEVYGTIQYYHPNGKILGKNKFSNGELKESDDFFDENGNSILSNGTGVYLQYHDNGKVAHRSNYINYCRSGKAQWYYENGQLEQEAIYKYSETQKPLGLRWEILSSFDRNGNERKKGTLKNGNGTWLSYDENEEITVTNYVDGIKKAED